MTETPTYYCSFCGKDNKQVRNLIAGPGPLFICNECVDLCQQINREKFAASAPETGPKAIFRVHYTMLVCNDAFEDFDTEQAAHDFAREKRKREHEFMVRHFERQPYIKVIIEARDYETKKP